MKNLKKKNQISALFSTQRPPDDWLDALDHLTIGLVANKYTQLGKTSENLLLSQGLSYIKIPLCYVAVHVPQYWLETMIPLCQILMEMKQKIQKKLRIC